MKVEELLRQNENKDNGISVPDNWEETSYDAKLFAIPEHYKPFIDKVMLPRGLVMDRTEKMGKFELQSFDSKHHFGELKSIE